jgi:putative Ca2+/H+ antiporter (TMEM165/GDT1 family)
MDMKLLLTVFGMVFLAELGDKTQLATLLFASRSPGNLITVFAGASVALILASAIGVVAGGAASHILNPRVLSVASGIGFVLIGAWTIWQGASAS